MKFNTNIKRCYLIYSILNYLCQKLISCTQNPLFQSSSREYNFTFYINNKFHLYFTNSQIQLKKTVIFNFSIYVL